MAKISFDTQVGKAPAPANKKLLAPGVYSALVVRYEKIVKDTGMSIKLTFGVLDPAQGITNLVPAWIALGSSNDKAKGYAVSTCQTLMNCLDIPSIFDDVDGIAEEDLKHILFKKIVVHVEIGNMKTTNGQEIPINKIQGYAPYALVTNSDKPVQQEYVAKPSNPTPSRNDVSSEMPRHMMEEEVPISFDWIPE